MRIVATTRNIAPFISVDTILTGEGQFTLYHSRSGTCPPISLTYPNGDMIALDNRREAMALIEGYAQ